MPLALRISHTVDAAMLMPRSAISLNISALLMPAVWRFSRL
jgi:hypothetical protein